MLRTKVPPAPSSLRLSGSISTPRFPQRGAHIRPCDRSRRRLHLAALPSPCPQQLTICHKYFRHRGLKCLFPLPPLMRRHAQRTCHVAPDLAAVGGFPPRTRRGDVEKIQGEGAPSRTRSRGQNEGLMRGRPFAPGPFLSAREARGRAKVRCRSGSSRMLPACRSSRVRERSARARNAFAQRRSALFVGGCPGQAPSVSSSEYPAERTVRIGSLTPSTLSALRSRPTCTSTVRAST